MFIRNDILERRSKLSPAKRMLLEKRVGSALTGNLRSQIIPRHPEKVLVPPSLRQQRLWFVDQLEPNSAVYNIPSAFRLRGPLNVEALRRGLQEILARLGAFRTTLSDFKGRLIQIISTLL